jgi:FkbM family methyltransferase
MKLKQLIKTFIKSIINLLINNIKSSKIKNFVIDEILASISNQKASTSFMNTEITLSIPNSLAKWRLETFSTKEPETLAWINEMPEGSVFWDVGANVGLYSLYAAKKRNAKVYSFEPSVFNLELLARNIHLNNLVDNICIIPLALNDEIGINTMIFSNTDLGGALSSFGVNYGFDGEELKSIFKYKTFGIDADSLIHKLKLSPPDFLKIDVDGIEHLILSGADEALQYTSEILIEVTDDFIEQKETINTILSKKGFKLVSSHYFKDQIVDEDFPLNHNQIWKKA